MRHSQRHILVAAWIVAVTALLGAAPALAYPQWQFLSGATRCSQCHYAPGGGGLLTSYGHDAAGDELSMFPGNGALLHGAVQLPSRLAIGGNVRGALLAHDVQDPGGPTTAWFPMQADLHARIALGAGLSITGTGGLRGRTRDPDAVVPMQNYQPVSGSRLISREHYLTWQPEALGPYLRAGRFFAPFGLRLAEHITYVRRDLGFNQLEESYNVSGGVVQPGWELHVTAFAPDFVRGIGGTEKGLAAYYEHRVRDDSIALGGQTRLAFGVGVSRFVLGGVAKWHLEKLRTLVLAEANAVMLAFDSDVVGTRAQFVGAAGFAVLPVRGFMVTLLGERNQIDIQVRDAALSAGTALLNWFPYPHIELQVAARVQMPAGGQAARTLLAQLHYYL